jgi:hypothetical protein
MRKGQGTGAEVLTPGETGIGGSNAGARAMGCAPRRCTRPLTDPKSALPTGRLSEDTWILDPQNCPLGPLGPYMPPVSRTAWYHASAHCWATL